MSIVAGTDRIKQSSSCLPKKRRLGNTLAEENENEAFLPRLCSFGNRLVYLVREKGGKLTLWHS